MGQNAAAGTATAITGLAGDMASYQQQAGLANASKYLQQANIIGGYGSQLANLNNQGAFNNLFGGGGSAGSSLGGSGMTRMNGGSYNSGAIGGSLMGNTASLTNLAML